MFIEDGILGKIERNMSFNSEDDYFFRKNIEVFKEMALHYVNEIKNSGIHREPELPLRKISDEAIIELVAGFFGELNPEYEKEFREDVRCGVLKYNENIKFANFDYKFNRYGPIEYSVEIPKTNTIRDAISMVHEFIHKKTFLDQCGFPIQSNRKEIFDEFPSILTEFMFIDYLKDFTDEKGLEELENAKGRRKNDFLYVTEHIALTSFIYELLEKDKKITEENLNSLKNEELIGNGENIRLALEKCATEPSFYRYFIGTEYACEVYDRGITKEDLCWYIENLNNCDCLNCEYFGKIKSTTQERENSVLKRFTKVKR